MQHCALHHLHANQDRPCPPLAFLICTPIESVSVLTTWAMPHRVTLSLFGHRLVIEFFNGMLKGRLRYSMGMLENMYKDLYIPKTFPLCHAAQWAHGMGSLPKAIQH